LECPVRAAHYGEGHRRTAQCSRRAALKDETIRKRLLELGAELSDEPGQTPAALGELVRSEIDKWVPIIRKAGVVVN
jgi:tripartite-type tricarboxylate transporter receptor subunit TctC